MRDYNYHLLKKNGFSFRNRHKISVFFAYVSLSWLFFGCQAQPGPEYAANIFKPWDGKWQGTFIVYSDTLGQREKQEIPQILSKAYLEKLPLKVSLSISVKQHYQSESPYYQTVKIEDTYTDGAGQVQVVESKGYNQVKGAQILCVVNKPDEQVIHQGSVPQDSTIIWQRSLSDPTKVEYFYEQVMGDTYLIVGYGYYGGDDPKLSPKTWFLGEYKRE